MAHHPARLLRRLNPYCAQALTAAASLCQSRGHALISIEHWLLKLLEQGQGDLGVIARRHSWDLDALWQGLLAHFDSLPRSVCSKPQLSHELQQLITRAWLRASLDDNSQTLRSADLFGALLETPSLLRCTAAWPLLSISSQQLQQLLPALEHESEECPETQALEIEAPVPPDHAGANHFERDAALERRFQRVQVDEPDDDNACLMLRGLKARYASHHGVHIQDAAVQAAVTLSRRYLTGRRLPDKAVDLLDTASARVRMGLDCEPQALVQLKARQSALTLESQALHEDAQLNGHGANERMAGIEAQRAQLDIDKAAWVQRHQQVLALSQQLLKARQVVPLASAHCASLQQQLDDLQGTQPLLSLDVTARSVAEVVADWTGVPLGSLLKDEHASLLALEQQLAARVIGQDAALTAMAQRLRAARTGLTNDKAPQGVFLLVGSSGVGKTETALALADSLFGGDKSLITLNLSEYQEAHTVSQLKGSPPGYVGYGQGGVLTEAVRQRPYSVVLLDEVEKAHRDVINLFYQVFDRGFMRDGEGREIDFRNTVILMTSNLGSDLLLQCLHDQPATPDIELQALLRPTLSEHFQPALLARFQTLIYRPLGAQALKGIVAIKLGQVAQRLRRHYGLHCVIEAPLQDALVQACLLPDSGARNIDSLLDQQILPVLSQQLLQRQAVGQAIQAVTLGYSDAEGITLQFAEAQGVAVECEHV